MSTIGKIFTVLNLILAAAFLGWAANALKANQDYKGKYEQATRDWDLDKKRLSDERTVLAAKLTDVDKQLQARTSERDELRNAKERLDTTVAELNKTGTIMQQSLDKIALTIQGIEEKEAQLQADKDKADKAQRDADLARQTAEAARGEADSLANDLKGQLDTANNTIADLEKARTSLQKERSGLETQLETLVANTGANVSDFAPVPDIQGGVLAVSMAVEPGIISLNVGANKGVKRGYTFEVYDGKTYKGQARVEFVHPEMSSAIITRKVAGQSIRQGDSAATRL